MSPRALLLPLLLCATARAQLVPAEPTPAESANAIGAQAAKDPAAASAALDDLYRRLSSPRIVLPTWEEVQQDRLRRDLSRPPDGSATTDAQTYFGLSRIDPQLRTTRESVDVTLSRPFPRVGLGAGWTQTTIYVNDQRVSRDEAKYFLLTVDVSRLVRPARLLTPPLVDHAETEVSPSHVRVTDDRRVVDSLKLPKN